jgi:hypothetical protein
LGMGGSDPPHKLVRLLWWVPNRLHSKVMKISSYSHNLWLNGVAGEIKEKYQELNYYLQEEITQNEWAVRKHSRSSTEPPSLKIKFHNVSNKNGSTNGM